MKDYEPVMSFDEEVARKDRDYRRGDEAAAVAFLAGSLLMVSAVLLR